MKQEKKRVHMIACGVLSVDIEAIQDELGIDMSVEYLPGGLHETPLKLKERLQERIDAASRDEVADMIALGYGICGKGSIGIKARNIPLAIAKVHDCIALFLGSDREYRRQFAACPGTYYISAGWVNEKVTPQDLCKTCQLSPEERVDFSTLIDIYGQENAEDIKDFYSSWQRNYSRAAFIDTGVSRKNERYVKIATRMAEDFGWRYERIEGTHHLLKSLLCTRSTSDEILIVPPNYMTVWDAVNNTLGVSTVWGSGVDIEKTAVYYDCGEEITEENYFERISVQPAGAKLGLGIDAGGTFTDVVLYDFLEEKVLKKAKAPTTKWDFTIGINEAISRLELERPEEIELVTLSTTLATNSIVEGKGQKVGLLIMPPYGIYQEGDIDFEPVAVIPGRLDINGREVEPVAAVQVREIAAKMMASNGVEAFAVTGFASINNNEHELEVKRILKEAFDCSVTCGHEISAKLNYRVRSVTSALNASIIPCLEKLLGELQESLAAQKISARQMVVRSDGSLMSVNVALQRPIETILSGPAASARGAGFLAGVADGLVIDIGGTTTDTALLRDGRVQSNIDGASVGGYRTHITTLDLRAAGLGGDSNIHRVRSGIVIGPQRVLPVSRAALEDAGVRACIEWAASQKDRFVSESFGLEILLCSGKELEAGGGWSEREREIVRILAAGAKCQDQLARELGCLSAKYLPLERLEAAAVIKRCGLTPTDLLHVLGKVDFADREAAEALCGIFAGIAGVSETAFAEDTLLEVRKLLALEMIKRELAGQAEVEELEESPLARVLLDNLYTEGNSSYRVGFTLKHPVIGIGAPTAELLVPAHKWLDTDCIIPEHAEVANAVGAIISPVHIEREVRIEPGATGEFMVQGVAGAQSFSEFDEAHEVALRELQALVTAAAREAGAGGELVKIGWHDRISDMYDDGAIFIARVYTGETTGMPSVE